MVRKRGGRKRALGTRAPMAIPQGANQRRWSLDFVSDALACGRKFRHSHCGRRLQPRMPGSRRRQLPLRHSARVAPRARSYRGDPWQTVHDRQRQRPNSASQWERHGSKSRCAGVSRSPVVEARTKWLPLCKGALSTIANEGSAGTSRVLTVLKTRYATRGSARTLSMAQDRRGWNCALTAPSERGPFHLAPADQRTAGNRLRSARLHARRAPSWRRRPLVLCAGDCLFSGSLAI